MGQAVVKERRVAAVFLPNDWPLTSAVFFEIFGSCDPNPLHQRHLRHDTFHARSPRPMAVQTLEALTII